MQSKTGDPDLKNEHSFAVFKKHFTLYVIIVATIGIALHFLAYDLRAWTFYIGLGWGAILAIHFLIAYLSIQKQNKNK